MDKRLNLAFYLPVNYLDDCEGLLLTKFPISDKTAEGQKCGDSSQKFYNPTLY